jgi:membrane peptidoglycan carboxypeptidase
MRTPIRLAHKRAPSGTGFKRAPFFCNAVVEQLRDKYGDDLLYKGGFKVVTTLSWKMQQVAEEKLREGISEGEKRFDVHDGALVCLDPNTGYVRALVGGVDYKKNQFDVVTQGRRQPGSSFKAFVYTAAIEHGWTPYQSIDASTRSHKAGDKWYTPHNDDDDRYGRVQMVRAFAKSINTAAVNTIEVIGPSTVADYAHRFGIKSHLNHYLSLALGSSEVSPLEMANAYGVFAANGIRAEPQMVRKIIDRMGNVIEDNSPVLHRVGVKPETINAMQELFQAVVQYGTAASSGAANVPTAHGKTGTTENHTDAWFIGYTLQPRLVTAVWAGNRNNRPMRHAFGGTVCAPIWARFMTEAVKIVPKTKMDLGEHIASGDLGARERDEQSGDTDGQKPKPQRRASRDTDSSDDQPEKPPSVQAAPGDAAAGNMVRVRVCEESMELATSRCPSVRTLEYVSGLQPTTFCRLHRRQRTWHRARRHRERARPSEPSEPAPTEAPQPARADSAASTDASAGATPSGATASGTSVQ